MVRGNLSPPRRLSPPRKRASRDFAETLDPRFRGDDITAAANARSRLRSRGVTVWRQLIDADPGKRRKLAIGILFEVGLDQRRAIARADKLPKRQFNFPVMRIPHADGVLLDRLEANARESDEAALRILLKIGFVLTRQNAVLDRVPKTRFPRPADRRQGRSGRLQKVRECRPRRLTLASQLGSIANSDARSSRSSR